MGKCISKPVVAAATAVEFPAENKKPVEESAADGGVVKSSSDRSLQHLFEKDVDEDEEDGSGQLKRIPEEDSSSVEEQEKPVEKSGSLETIPEDKSPESEDENPKVVVVVLQAEKIVPAEVEKREVQVEAPEVVDKEPVQVVQVGSVRPSSESKSPPDEVSELHAAVGEDVEIHKHSEDSEDVQAEGEVCDVVAAESTEGGEGESVGVGASKDGEEQVVEEDTQVAPEARPREILDTDGVIIPNTRASLQETHEEEEDGEVDVKALKALNDLERHRETGEGGLVDVKEMHEEETDRHEQILEVKEVHDEKTNGQDVVAEGSEAGTESTVVEQLVEVPAQGSPQGDESVEHEKTEEEPSTEYKRAEDDLHEAKDTVKDAGTEVPSAVPLAAEEQSSEAGGGEDVDVQEVKVKAEEPRSELPVAEPVLGAEGVENPNVPQVTEVLQAPSYSPPTEVEASDVQVDVPEASDVLESQSSSAEVPGEEFFEASEQIAEFESEQIPELVESADKTKVHADQPQAPEVAEIDKTPTKVNVPIEETTSNVPPEKSVQPVEVTKASSTG